MLARGGHHLEREFDFDPGNDESKRTATREEATELIELWHGRTYETKLPQRNFISPRDQWQSDGDLTDKVRLVRVSLDYDFKREPVDVVEIDGVLNFTTRPWADIDAFKAARGNLDSLDRKQGLGAQEHEGLDRFPGLERQSLDAIGRASHALPAGDPRRLGERDVWISDPRRQGEQGR